MGLDLVVNAGEHARRDAFARVTVDAASLPSGGMSLVDSVTGTSLPVQASDAVDGKVELTFPCPYLVRRETRRFQLVTGSSPGRVAVSDKGGAIAVEIGGEPFTTMLYGPEHYRPHWYPVLGPGGKEVTETGASDHKHHRSLYVAYGEVNGVDCWAEGANSGRVVVQKLSEAKGGSVFGTVTTESLWQSLDGKRLMTDRVSWRIYALPVNRRIIESVVEFRATEGDVHFGDTKEGGIMSVRVAPMVKVSNTGIIVNSFGGTNERETWGKRANWCDYSGYIDGVHLGIAIMDHIGNPRHPCHWHVRDYGLMTTNIFGRGTFESGRKLLDGDGQYVLKAGDSLTFRYQVVVHAGDAEDADLAGAYHNFVNPPSVTVG